LGSESIETTDEGWFDETFVALRGAAPADFVSRDGTVLVEIRPQSQGVRSLYEGLMRIALAVEKKPDCELGCLVLSAGRMRIDRIEREWADIQQLLQPAISRRLALIVMTGESFAIRGEHEWLPKIAEAIRNIEAFGFVSIRERRRLPHPSKQVEIYKVLLNRWLLSRGEIGIGELQEHVGCSYPTVRKGLDTFGASTEPLRRGKATGFPSDLWNAIVAAAADRISFAFVDRSGQLPNPEALARRVAKLSRPDLAIGGVIAARRWHPNFDLNGMPRLDLVMHCPAGAADLRFVKKLDPALKEVEGPMGLFDSPTLVVHALQRRVSDFQTSEFPPICDPVETALDLLEMGLTTQADALFQFLHQTSNSK